MWKIKECDRQLQLQRLNGKSYHETENQEEDI